MSMDFLDGAGVDDLRSTPPVMDVHSSNIGPVEPSPEVREELIAFLEHDDSRLGEVYRRLQRDMTAEQIAVDLDVATSGFVWSYDRLTRSMLNGDLPTAPSVAQASARRFRSLLKLPGWTDACISYLEHNLVELESRAANEIARGAEVQKAKTQTAAAEARNEPGLYVYALPHYLTYPYEPDSGRTLLKVGRSDSDVIRRFRDQTRTTALPEEPLLLRIYRANPGATASLEATVHRLLEAADHDRSVARTAGREWFVTSTRFLDEIARALSLESVVVTEIGDE